MSRAAHLSSGRLLARNIVWSFAGAALPLLVGLWAIPELIQGLGKDRFGLLAIIWVGIGYFSLFDLGIGRALTKLIAERLGAGKDEDLPHLIRVGLRLMWYIGTIAAVAVIALSPVLIERLLQVPPHLQDEGKWSLWILASVLPFVVGTAGLIGVLQAHQRFRAIAAVRVPLGLANFLGPVLVLPLTNSLVATTITLAIARVGAWLAYHTLCRSYREPARLNSTNTVEPVARHLLAFGGWITVSNILGPMMVYFDRLLIGGVLGLVAVTYYTTPYEIVTRLWVVPGAIADVLFPALTAALVASTSRAKELYVTAIYAQGAIMLPVISLLSFFGPMLLGTWIGEDFATNSTSVLRWLAVGVYINCFARMPFALLQGNGRPDITAKLHVVELPLYFLALWFLTNRWGIEGAAVAWTGRIALDTLALFLLAARKIPALGSVQYTSAAGVAISSAAIMAMWVELPALQLFAAIAALLMVAVWALLVVRAILGRIAGRPRHDQQHYGFFT